MGMGNIMGTSEMDERGRVTIPKEIREKAGIKSGDKLQLKAERDKVTIVKAITLDKFMSDLRGCITVRGDIDPLKLKEIWRSVE